MGDISLSILGIIIILGVVAFWTWYAKKGKIGGGGSILAQYSKDLTQAAREGKIDPVIGRDKEIIRVTEILTRRTKSNPVLIGNAGVGKTAIADGLALKIVQGKVPQALKNKKVLNLDITSLLSGTKYRGEFEQRLQSVIKEIEAAKRGIIVFIDELHILAESGEAEGAVGAGDILKPMLARGDLQVIGASTFKEYFKTIHADPTIERRFQPVYIKEPSPEDALKMLKGLRKSYEDFHQLKITDEALEAAIQLSKKYIKNRSFPDKAIDLMDEACARVRLASAEKGKSAVKVTAKDIEEVLRESREMKSLNIEETAKEKES